MRYGHDRLNDGRGDLLPLVVQGLFSAPHQTIFLKEALGAAYTPRSIGGDGKVYSQNDRRLFVAGKQAADPLLVDRELSPIDGF